jgi:hypothetical protein
MMNNEQIFETNYLSEAKVTSKMRNWWQRTAPFTLIISIANFVYLFIATLTLVVSALFLNVNTLKKMPFPEVQVLGPQIGIVLYSVFAFCLLILLFNFFMYRELFLYQPAIQKALKYNNQQQLEKAWRHLRNYFRFLGLVAIILLLFFIYGGVTLANLAAEAEARYLNEYPF